MCFDFPFSLLSLSQLVGKDIERDIDMLIGKETLKKHGLMETECWHLITTATFAHVLLKA